MLAGENSGGFGSCCFIGASLSEPHHVRSTVKFVFLLACLYVCLYANVLNSRDRQGMYGMQHFRMPRNTPYKMLWPKNRLKRIGKGVIMLYVW